MASVPVVAAPLRNALRDNVSLPILSSLLLLPGGATKGARAQLSGASEGGLSIIYGEMPDEPSTIRGETGKVGPNTAYRGEGLSARRRYLSSSRE